MQIGIKIPSLGYSDRIFFIDEIEYIIIFFFNRFNIMFNLAMMSVKYNKYAYYFNKSD